MVYKYAVFQSATCNVLVLLSLISFCFFTFCIFYNIVQGYAQYITAKRMVFLAHKVRFVPAGNSKLFGFSIHIVSYFVDAGRGAGYAD